MRAGVSLNATAGWTVYKRAGTRNPLCVYETVDGYAKTRGKKEVRRWRGGYGGHEALAKDFLGTAGKDTLFGTAVKDYLTGRAGDDYLDAGGGNDTIEGGRGDDQIIPGEGADKVYAGAGNDRIYARDTASFDYIDCGGGFDQV